MNAPIRRMDMPPATLGCTTVGMGVEILDRMERAVAKVRERLLRATAVLNAANIPYAVVGGNAVASWIATVDEGAVRNTPNVDLLARREDISAITAALAATGFVSGDSLGVVTFLDGAGGKPREAVRLLFTGEKTRYGALLPTPAIDTIDDPAGFRVIILKSLIEMKLMANRRIDRVHIRDLIGVGLIDQTWLAKFPPELADRLKLILDTPDD